MDEVNAELERLLLENKSALERFVYCKTPSKFDGDDVLQEIYLTAIKNFDALNDKAAFKPWIMRIAKNKCADFYRARTKALEIPFDYAEDIAETGFAEHELRLEVHSTLEHIPKNEKQILYLFYICGFSQKDIALRLGIPVGTVKSRLYSAKQSFISKYDRKNYNKENNYMKNFSKYAPEYKIIKSDKPSFDLLCEEVPGWPVIPRKGEKSSFAFYDDAPDGSAPYITGITEMECTKNAVIHGVNCVKIEILDTEVNSDGSCTENNQNIFVRLTDTHCMYIAEMYERDDTIYFSSFMDDEWLERYEIGANNCGRAVHQTTGTNVTLNSDGSMTISNELIENEDYELCGRYEIEISSCKYDTMRMVSLTPDGILVFQYIDKSGRTVLFRRFNKSDWQSERRGYLWTDKLPNSERITVNGGTYVHWYDCISDYVIH